MMMCQIDAVGDVALDAEVAADVEHVAAAEVYVGVVERADDRAPTDSGSVNTAALDDDLLC